MSLPTLNHTQISNAFIENWMPKLNSSCTLVFLVISRKTIGWHKATDAISLTTIQGMTGLSRQGVVNAISELESSGLIEATRKDKTTTVYTIHYERLDQSNELADDGSQLSLPGSQISGPENHENNQNLVNSVDTQKKDNLKETNKKKRSERSEPNADKNSIQYQLAHLLYTEHKKLDPKYLAGKDVEKVVSGWIDEIDKLIRIDQRAPEEVRQVILWSKAHVQFWASNIMSGKTLRARFDTLVLQMARKGGQGNYSKPSGVDHSKSNSFEEQYKRDNAQALAAIQGKASAPSKPATTPVDDDDLF